MSHLSILPTVLRRTDLLARSLEASGLTPIWGGQLEGFGADSQPVELQIHLDDGLRLGWQRQGDGSLALLADLQRLSRRASVAHLIDRITRHYAAQLALDEAHVHLPGALVTLRS